MNVDDVEESELWDISYFADFHIKLVNKKDKAEIIDMEKWIREHGLSG